jgi:predicted Zn-dependent peptidase
VRLEKDLSSELKKLKELLDEGIITQQEFETEKKELLEKY